MALYCWPGATAFGPEYTVTACDGAVVLELNNKPAAEVVLGILEEGRRHADFMS